MDTEKHRNVNTVARRQLGHLTRAQARAAGWSGSTLRRHAASGLLVPTGPETYRLGSVARSVRGDVMAACLDVDGVASHRTAAWLHGLMPVPSAIEVSIGKGRSMFRRGTPPGQWPHVRLHATTALPAEDILRLGPIPVTSVARTALGLAALVPGELEAAALAKIVDKAVDGGLASDPWLWWFLARRRCRGRNGVAVLEAVLAERARLGPTESWLEREVLRILEEAGLPLPRTQRVVRRSGRFAARVDFIYEPEGVVAEALGYARHRTPQELEADTRRANELQLLGFDVYQFSFNQVVRSPASLVATVGRALGIDPVVTPGIVAA